MPNPIIILHGWSDTYESFVGLKDILNASGLSAADLHLGNYQSMDDNVTFDDLADGLQARLQDKQLKLEPFSLDVIAHSTGGPVIRHWLMRYINNVCNGDVLRCPIKRMILLAPANFGSRLAAQGQSAIAMLFKGNIKNGFQTGKHILQGLELGSPFMCNLADRDLFGEKAMYPCVPDQGPFVFVLSGTSTFGELKGLLAPGANENGSDGTIRAASASLNSVRIRADYTQQTPEVTARRPKHGPIAFKLVEGKNHTEIVPQDGEVNHPTVGIVRECLKVDDFPTYDKIRVQFDAENAQFYLRQANAKGGVRRHQQFVFRVLDDMGNEVADYQLAFHVVGDARVTSTWDAQLPQHLSAYQDYTARLQNDVICDIQLHSVSKSHRTYFIDLDALERLQNDLDALEPRPFIAMNVNALSPVQGITFDTDRFYYIPLNRALPSQDATPDVSFFHPNTTTLVDIVLKPVPDESIFKIY